MIDKPSLPFSNGTDYECFLYTYCYNCKHYKENEFGFPEYPENGGCRICDAMENARFDLSLFPNKKIRQVEYDDGQIQWHKCIEFEELRGEW